MTVKAAGVPLDKEEVAKDGDASPAISRLRAHFDALDENALMRVARAVEMARAVERSDPTDEQILDTLRPRLRELKPPRLSTFQRAICCAVEVFLFDGTPADEKRKAAIPRQLLKPWWRVLSTSPHWAHLHTLELDYTKAVEEQRWGELAPIVDQGILAAGDATLTLLGEAERSLGRRAELVSLLGGDRFLADMREIGILMRLHPHLSPALERIQRAAGINNGGRIFEFTPAAVIAARTAYLNLHNLGAELVEYFFFGLISLLAQPFQALRLVRVLSQEMSSAGGDSPARLIPARLFSDLTHTLAEIGRQAQGPATMGRRVWLLTSAKLLSDAALMIRGLAEEAREQAGNVEWQKLLAEARGRVIGAVDIFASAALQDCLAVLPTRESQERPGAEIRVEPDMVHAPTDEDQGIAMAAALLLTSLRKLVEQEGQERVLRTREADLVQGLEIAIKFRVEYLRARPRHAIALAQLGAIHRVLKTLPSVNIIRDLEHRVGWYLERYSG
jgi:hypothetical protein